MDECRLDLEWTREPCYCEVVVVCVHRDIDDHLQHSKEKLSRARSEKRDICCTKSLGGSETTSKTVSSSGLSRTAEALTLLPLSPRRYSALPQLFGPKNHISPGVLALARVFPVDAPCGVHTPPILEEFTLTVVSQS